MAALKTDLLSSDLVANPLFTSPQEFYLQYESTLSHLLDKHAPIRHKQVKQETNKWITTEFFHAKRLKRLYERIWRHTRSASDLSRFRRQINLCNSIINKA